MQYPSQLTPIQAWLLGYIDGPTLRDQLTSLDEYARVIADDDHAATLIAEANSLLGEPPG